MNENTQNEHDPEVLPLATELMHELKASSKRWFVAFIAVLALWFATIGIFVWYISLPIEETTVELSTQDNGGNANYINGKGDIYNGENKSSQEAPSSAE